MTRAAPPSRRERLKEDRKSAILSAARDVFFKDGLHRATVDSIAARAEVAKGTVYLYFPSKETMLGHLVIEGLDSLYARLEKAYDESAPARAEARLRRLAAAYFEFYQAEPDYFQLMMAFDRGQFRESISTELYQNILHRSLGGLHWLVRAIEQGIAARELAPGEPKQIAGSLWAALNGVLVLTSHPLRREILAQDVRTLYDGVMDVLLRGMKNNGK
jgi:AcrR family transcriptional regulator